MIVFVVGKWCVLFFNGVGDEGCWLVIVDFVEGFVKCFEVMVIEIVY